MITDDKEWILRQLSRMRQTCTKANEKRRQDYDGRIKLIDRVIGFVEGKDEIAKESGNNPLGEAVFKHVK